MLVWRVARKAHAEQSHGGATQLLSGEGAKRYGGRWNHIGVAVVYTSQSLSLAVLEHLVNLPISDLPDDLVSIQIEFVDDLPRTELRLKDLPDNWRAFPAIEELKDLGSEWARKAATPVLVVPSVVIPNELNYLINPFHPLATKIKIVSIDSFALDTRLDRTRKPSRKGSR